MCIAFGKQCTEKKIPLSKIIDIHLNIIQKNRQLLNDRNLSSSCEFLVRVIRTINLNEDFTGEALSTFYYKIIKILRELEEKENQTERYLDVAEVIFVVIGADERVCLINRKGCEILGYKKNEIIGKNWFNNFIPKRSRRYAAHFFHKLISGEIESERYYENPIITKTGEERTISWHIKALTDEEGDIIGAVSSGKDITEHRKAEKALRESEKKYRTLVQTARDAIITIDIKGNIVSWNDAAEAIFGYSAREAIGKPLTIIIPKRFRRDFENGMEKIAAGKLDITHKRVEWFGVKRDGTEFPAEVSINKWATQEGTFFTSILRDISQRKRMEEKLNSYIKELTVVHEIDKNILENLDLQALLQFVVGKARELTGADAAFFGFVEDDVIVHHSFNGIHTEDFKRIRLEKGAGLGWLAIQEKKPIIVDDFFSDQRLKKAPYQEVEKEGLKSFLVVPIISRGRDPVGVLYVANRNRRKFRKDQVRTLTTLASQSSVAIAHAKLFEEIKRAYEELKSLDSLKTNILTNVTHELRTPVTIIKSSLEIAREEKDPKEKNKYINIASSALIRQERIISNLVEAMRIEKAEIKLNFEEVNLYHLITLIEAEFRYAASKKELMIKVDIDKGLTVIGDYSYLAQVLRNIFDNAVKFNKDGGEISVSVEKKDGEVVVCVEDGGIGIPKDKLEKIFDRFYQIESSTSRRYSGTGMGLAVAKKIVEAHGGRIWAESKVGEGSKFYFTLPISYRNW